MKIKNTINMLNNKKQSFLEKKGIAKRQEEFVRSDYNESNSYSENHNDAISTGDKPLGKGTNSGGHQHVIPDYNKPSTLFNYSNLDTSNGGGSYDIHGRDGRGGRNTLLSYNIYNKDNAYGPESVEIDDSISGQYTIRS